MCVWGGGVLIPITIFHSTVQNPSGQRPKKAKQFRYFWTGVLCIERKTVSADVQSIRSLLANLFINTNHKEQGNILYIE